MIKSAVGYCAVILVGSLLASLVGGVFAALIAIVSPEFVGSIFSLPNNSGGLLRYSFAVGMLWGLFIGMAATFFTCGLSALVQIIRLRIDHKKSS